ncbi:HAD family phosphatase [Candidatus Giovannonibacteria bacterium]|nr:HAD family phosphatase [Candidatus Giovannonibacteria bacterium]
MIRGIIFDFGDVICFWKTDALGEARSLALGLPKESIKDIIWDYLNAAHEGTYHSVQDYFERAKPEASVGVDIVAEVFDEMEASASIDQRMVDFITVLKRQYKVALLSNFPKGIEDYLAERFHIEHLFDAVVSSYNIQKKKPSLDAYRYASDQIALKPEECLFVDDSENNVLAAKEAGMRGLVFKNFEDFKEQFESIFGRNSENP